MNFDNIYFHGVRLQSMIEPIPPAGSRYYKAYHNKSLSKKDVMRKYDKPKKEDKNERVI